MARPTRIPTHAIVPIIMMTVAIAFGIQVAKSGSVVAPLRSPTSLLSVGYTGAAIMLSLVAIAGAAARLRVVRALRELMDDTPLSAYRDRGSVAEEAGPSEFAAFASLPTLSLSSGLGDSHHRILHSLPGAWSGNAAVVTATRFLTQVARTHPTWGLARERRRAFRFTPNEFTLILLRERLDSDKEFAAVAIGFKESRGEVGVTIESHAVRPSPLKILVVDLIGGGIAAASDSAQGPGYRFAAEKTCAVMLPEVHAALDRAVMPRPIR